MTKKNWSLLVLLMALMLVLAACGGGSNTDGNKNDGNKDNNSSEEGNNNGNGNEADDEEGFPISVENEGEAIDGGTLKVALQKDDPFKGILSYTLYQDAYDADLLSFATNSLFETDGDFLLTDEGIASIDVKQAENEDDDNIVTVKIREGVKWSDGEPLTIDDVIYPYYIIGHPDYTGDRYNAEFRNIIGVEEYHGIEDEETGEVERVEEISGIVRVDDHTMELHLKDISPSIFSGGDGLWTYAEPKHIIGDIPIAELVEHDAVRVNPVTLGPFKFEKIVPGESVQYVANEHYWKGEPKIDEVLLNVVPSSSISKALESGEYDIALGFGSAKYEEIKDLENIDILARPELYYNYIGFSLGKWDSKAKEVATDLENSKMGDKNLRHAMIYAMNVEEVNEAFYDGLRERANAIIPPAFSSFHDESLEGFTYDPDKANELLDEAGYEWVEGEEFRRDKNGDPFEISFATMSGDDVAEQISAFWLENWADVGLNVKYATGRTIEFNAFYDKLEADDEEFEVFMGAWGVGTNPSPAGIYAKEATFNFSRYTDEDLQQTLINIDSNKSFDEKYRAEQFAKFEEIVADVAQVAPIQYRLEIFPINKRIKNYSIDYENPTELHELELVADNPVK